jgi:hypothetical protein
MTAMPLIAPHRPLGTVRPSTPFEAIDVSARENANSAGSASMAIPATSRVEVAPVIAIAATATAHPVPPVTQTHLCWRHTHGVIAASGSIDPDSRMGTRNPIVHNGVPSDVSSHVSTVDAFTT